MKKIPEFVTHDATSARSYIVSFNRIAICHMTRAIAFVRFCSIGHDPLIPSYKLDMYLNLVNWITFAPMAIICLSIAMSSFQLPKLLHSAGNLCSADLHILDQITQAKRLYNGYFMPADKYLCRVYLFSGTLPDVISQCYGRLRICESEARILSKLDFAASPAHTN